VCAHRGRHHVLEIHVHLQRTNRITCKGRQACLPVGGVQHFTIGTGNVKTTLPRLARSQSSRLRCATAGSLIRGLGWSNGAPAPWTLLFRLQICGAGGVRLRSCGRRLITRRFGKESRLPYFLKFQHSTSAAHQVSTKGRHKFVRLRKVYTPSAHAAVPPIALCGRTSAGS